MASEIAGRDHSVALAVADALATWLGQTGNLWRMF